MVLTDPDLWSRIRDYDLPHRVEWDVGAPRRCRTFADNLRKLGDWTDESAARLVMEYRRFLYLKALEDDLLTPPQCIDDAWHLHMALDLDFNHRFCKQIGRKITHQTGLSAAARRAAYERVLARYVAEFHVEAPPDIWPSLLQLKRHQTGETIGVIGVAVLVIGIALWLSSTGGRGSFPCQVSCSLWPVQYMAAQSRRQRWPNAPDELHSHFPNRPLDTGIPALKAGAAWGTRAYGPV